MTDQLPNRTLLGYGEFIDRGDMLPGNDEHVALGDREGVQERDRLLSLDQCAFAPDGAE